MLKQIHTPTEKQCSRCKETKPWREFYVVPSYPDSLSRICKPCNTEDVQIRQHRRQLKQQGRQRFTERITQLRALADAMEKVLGED